MEVVAPTAAKASAPRVLPQFWYLPGCKTAEIYCLTLLALQTLTSLRPDFLLLNQSWSITPHLGLGLNGFIWVKQGFFHAKREISIL